MQGNTLPLAAGQVWDIQGLAGSTAVAVKVNVPVVNNPNPGVYASSDALGILSALSGMGEPVVLLNLNKGEMNFFLRQGEGFYICKISNLDAKNTVFEGQLFVRDDVVGTCTANAH